MKIRKEVVSHESTPSQRLAQTNAFRIFILCLACLAYVLPLGLRPLVMPDEPRYAEIPREMLVSGDWIAPRLNGVPYYEKPPLGYWATAISIAVFGQNHFAVRLPAGLSGILSAACVFVLVYRTRRDLGAALLAAVILLTSMEFYFVSTIAVLDGPLTALLTACLSGFYLAWREEHARRRAGYLALAGIFCGLAFLTKGFLAFAVPVLTAAPFLFWQGNSKRILWQGWIGGLGILIVALPWSIAIHFRDGDFWRYFFWQEHIHRFFSDSAQHAEPWWYFLPLLPIGFLPWTFFGAGVVKGLRRITNEPLIPFAVCWFLWPFLFFSMSSGKLATYILPCFPPLSILAALGLREAKDSFKKARRACAGFTILLFLAVGLASTPLNRTENSFGSDESWKSALLLLAVGFWLGCVLLSGARRYQGLRTEWIALGPVCLMFALPAVFPDRLKPEKAPEKSLAAFRGLIEPSTILVSDKTYVHSVCLSYRRDDIFLFLSPGELEYGLNRAEHQNRLLDSVELGRRIQALASDQNLLCILKTGRWLDHAGNLPEPTEKWTFGDLSILEYRNQQAASTDVRQTRNEIE